jgi:hypothetical protein
MKKVYVSVGVITIVILGIAYWGISPLFNTIHANDALPSSVVSNVVKGPDAAASGQGSSTGPVSSDSTKAQVTGTAGHPASGTAQIIQADGKQYLRYENFKTINGPDIYVYLSKDLDAKDYVSLGKVRATEGNINYEIPSNIDVHAYPYVLTWCKTFGVLFNSAQVY